MSGILSGLLVSEQRNLTAFLRRKGAETQRRREDVLAYVMAHLMLKRANELAPDDCTKSGGRGLGFADWRGSRGGAGLSAGAVATGAGVSTLLFE